MPDIQGAVQGFFVALNTMFEGNSEPMKALWSHREDVVFYAPDGKMHKGWEAVSKCWDEQAAMKVGGSVEPGVIDYFKGQDLAAAYHLIEGHHVINGEQVPVHIRATELFRMEEGEWKVVSVQADVLPFLKEQGG